MLHDPTHLGRSSGSKQGRAGSPWPSDGRRCAEERKAVDGLWRLNGVSNRALRPIAFPDRTTTPMSQTPGRHDSLNGFFGWFVLPHPEHLPPESVQQPVGVAVTRGVRPEFDAPPIRVRPR